MTPTDNTRHVSRIFISKLFDASSRKFATDYELYILNGMTGSEPAAPSTLSEFKANTIRTYLRSLYNSTEALAS